MLTVMQKFAVGLLAAVLTLIGFATATPSQAHDELLSTTPKNGAQLASAPPAIVLKFEEAPLKDTTKIVATDSAGRQIPLTDIVLVGGTATAKWPTDASAGTYSVAWRNVGADGHPLSGKFTFSYTTANQGPTVTASPTGSPNAGIGVPTPVPTSSPVSATGPAGLGGTMWLLPTVIGVLIIVGGIFGIQAARKRKKNDRPNT